MTVSLYATTIPTFLQTLGAVGHLLDKAEAYCTDQNIAETDLIGARLAEDMLPFGYQARSVATHSIGAIEGVRNGVFSPDQTPWPETFAGLRALIEDARAELTALDPATLDDLQGRDMRFEFGAYRMDFTVEDFLLSFSQPNFFFHASMTYAILRMKKLDIGKRDYLGALRLKH
jgi:hypothetical protein